MNEAPTETSGGALQERLGRLAAVTRTWNWLRADPGRRSQLPYVGASCARLLSEVLELAAPEATDRPALEQLRARFLAFDELDGPGRESAMPAIESELYSLVSPGLLGMRMPPSEARGKFINPRRRNNRGGRRAEPVEESADTGSVDPPEASQVDGAQESETGTVPLSEGQVSEASDPALSERGDSSMDSSGQEQASAEAEPVEHVDEEEREFQRLMRDVRRGKIKLVVT